MSAPLLATFTTAWSKCSLYQCCVSPVWTLISNDWPVMHAVMYATTQASYPSHTTNGALHQWCHSFASPAAAAAAAVAVASLRGYCTSLRYKQLRPHLISFHHWSKCNVCLIFEFRQIHKVCRPLVTAISVRIVWRCTICVLWVPINPLKGRDVNWLHFAIQV